MEFQQSSKLNLSTLFRLISRHLLAINVIAHLLLPIPSFATDIAVGQEVEATEFKRCPFLLGAKSNNAVDKYPTISWMELLGLYFKSGRNFNELFKIVKEKYGPVVRIKTSFQTIIVTDPAFMKTVLNQTTKGPFEKSSVQWGSFQSLLGTKSLISARGDNWRGLHEQWKSHFTTRAIDGYDVPEKVVSSFDRYFQHFLSKKENTESVSVQHLSRTLGLAMAMKILYNVEMEPSELEHLSDIFIKVESAFSKGLAHRLPMRFMRFTRIQREEYAAYQELMKFTETQFDRQMQLPPEQRGFVINGIMELRDESGQPLTRKQKLENFLFFLVSGHETNASTIASALYEVGKRPDWQAQLHSEADSLEPHQVPSANSLIDDTLSETFRFATASYTLVRETQQDTQVALANGEKLNLELGTQLVFPLAQMNRDEEQWGMEALGYPANAFFPERFSQENLVRRGVKACDVNTFVFGSGKRVCVAQKLGARQILVALSYLFRNFDIKALTPYQETYVVGVTLKPNPNARISITPRGLSPVNSSTR